MSKKKSSSVGLMLIELVCAVLFFSLFSAVCVKIFVSASNLSMDSADLGSAVIAAENAAETFKGAEGNGELTAQYLGAESENGRIKLYYDADWSQCDAGSAEYEMTIEISDFDAVSYAQISLNNAAGDDIYTLEAAAIRGAR